MGGLLPCPAGVDPEGTVPSAVAGGLGTSQVPAAEVRGRWLVGGGGGDGGWGAAEGA